MSVASSLLWLPDVVRDAGLHVVEVLGWKTRGHPKDGPLAARAVMIHHDGSPFGDSPGALNYLINGFNSDSDDNYDAQVWINRYGYVYVVAAGRAQHAGRGTGWGRIAPGEGNRDSFGIETDHTDGEPWPYAQLRSLLIVTAAVCDQLGWNPADSVVGHKEYAPGRKTDPNPLDMAAFRRQVAARIAGGDDVSVEDVDAWMRARHGQGDATGVELLDQWPAVRATVGRLENEVTALRADSAAVRADVAEILARLPGTATQ